RKVVAHYRLPVSPAVATARRISPKSSDCPCAALGLRFSKRGATNFGLAGGWQCPHTDTACIESHRARRPQTGQEKSLAGGRETDGMSYLSFEPGRIFSILANNRRRSSFALRPGSRSRPSASRRRTSAFAL